MVNLNVFQWAPHDAPAPDAPAQGHDDDSARPLSLPSLNLLASLRVRQDEDNGKADARPSLPPHTSCKRGRCMSRCCEIPLQTACVMYTCFITPNQCPCLMRPLPCMAICRNTKMRRAASNHVSLSPLPRHCGARWAVHGRHAAEVRRLPRRQSRRMTMSPSFINSSASPTTLPSLLLRTCHAPVSGYFMGGEGALGPHQLLPSQCF